MRECILCGGKYIGYGNNAEPIKKGRCCDICDNLKVIPARLKLAIAKIKKLK